MKKTLEYNEKIFEQDIETNVNFYINKNGVPVLKKLNIRKRIIEKSKMFKDSAEYKL